MTQYYDQQYQNGVLVGNVYHPNHLTLGGTYLDTQPYPESPLTNDDIHNAVAYAIQQKNWPSESRHDIYFVYTGNGVQECLPNPGGCSNVAFCGWHDFFPAGTFTPNYVAYIPYPTGSELYGDPSRGCLLQQPSPNEEHADAAISTSSHELFETVSDPLGNSWFMSNVAITNSTEMADLCQKIYGTLDGSGANLTLNGHSYQVQFEYSNAAGGCTNTFDGQFINFGALADKTYGDAPFSLSTSANVTSGLSLSFAASGQCTGQWCIRSRSPGLVAAASPPARTATSRPVAFTIRPLR